MFTSKFDMGLGPGPVGISDPPIQLVTLSVPIRILSKSGAFENFGHTSKIVILIIIIIIIILMKIIQKSHKNNQNHMKTI